MSLHYEQREAVREATTSLPLFFPENEKITEERRSPYGSI